MSYEVLLVPATEEEPVERLRCGTADGESLPDLQTLVGGHIEALPVPDRDDITAYGNDEAKLIGLEKNVRATRFMGPLLFAGDHIAGPLVICGFDPETGENRDCPAGFEAVLTMRRELPAPTAVERRDRSIEYKWRLADDGHGKRVVAVLDVGHHNCRSRGGGEFVALLDTRTEEDTDHGVMVGIRVGSGIRVGVQPVARFSARGLSVFAEAALATLRRHYGDSDERVTRYFGTPSGGSL